MFAIILLAAITLHLSPSIESAAVTCKADDEEPWSYHGRNNGPSAWGERFPTCFGREQSPIAIKTKDTILDISAKKLLMKNYEIPITKATIVNNGHSVQITPRDNVARTIEIQGCTYTFQQLHFHWGSRYDRGSEHTLNDVRYALEAHFVHSSKDNAIAVVGVLFQAGTRNNAAFQPISNVLPCIPFKDNSVDLQSNLILNQLLPSNPASYFHYDGSLTTPGCSENVSWFVLKAINQIGEQQLTELRNLYSTTKNKANAACKIIDNFRPLQPLNGRTVFESPN
ncbi:carbonic anhydrase 6 [Nephila pilipes]|uniref:Carbonic anhydrase n=1 Tax=Nephila pilipes TaxID=299642 RepID=A0A8X6TWA3_NEPPI|nr:carbonic anhydrase 6 [Nephila pilipes]